MLTILKRQWLLFCGILVTLTICIWRVAHYYINGQAVASRHMDGHYGAFVVNLFYAVTIAAILVVVFTVVFLIKKYILKKSPEIKLAWFLLPAIFGAFAPIHHHIGSLFLCCPVGDGISPAIYETLFIVFGALIITMVSIGTFFLINWHKNEQ